MSRIVVLFFIYAFFGWCSEVAYTAVKEKKFVNRGFINGPFSILYGIMFLEALYFLEPVENNIAFLIVSSIILCSVIQFLVGFLLEKIFGQKWWDFSDRKYNIKGYVCLLDSVIRGTSVALVIKYVHPFINVLLKLIPDLVLFIAAIVLSVILVADLTVTFIQVRRIKKQIAFLNANKILNQLGDKVQQLTDGTQQFSNRLGSKLTRRVLKAYPKLEELFEDEYTAEGEKKVFASGINVYKLFWILVIGAVVGDIIETIFVFCGTGILMSRSSLIYGPFSMVWGIGAVILTIVLSGFVHKNDRYIFVGGLLVGGVYEYVCSVVTEMCFGTVFWDYSKIPFNINGRVNLLYCVFWGALSLVWVKGIYPKLSGLIERMPIRFGKILTAAFLVFLICDSLISIAALARLAERREGKEATTIVAAFLDEKYDDDFLAHRYQNMKFVSND